MSTTTPTMASALSASCDLDALWADVDTVERLQNGSDLYLYADGSSLVVSLDGTTIVREREQ